MCLLLGITVSVIYSNPIVYTNISRERVLRGEREGFKRGDMPNSFPTFLFLAPSQLIRSQRSLSLSPPTFLLHTHIHIHTCGFSLTQQFRLFIQYLA